MKYNCKIMSSGSGYTDPSIMITKGNQKYCFSMGNGIHRQSLGSSHSKPQDSDVLFLTHLDPTTEADLLNFILRNKVDISIIGPNGTTSNIDSYRHFLSKRHKTFYITECSNDENYHLTDGHISVYPVVIKNSNDSNSRNSNNNNNNGEIKTLPFSFNKSYDVVEKTVKESMRVVVGSVKSFYDWTILRGGILHGSTGSKFTMREIEQYAAYRLLKIDIKAGNSKCGPDESFSMYKPKNSKEIKKFLLDTQDSDYQDHDNSNSSIIPQTEKEKEFWCMESRHFRLVTRLSKSLRLTDSEKREMVRKRMNIYLKDTVYGPINSYATTFPKLKYSSDVLCYIVHFPDIIGKFSLDKANELGIFSFDRSKLCKGQSVFSEKVGRIITPDEVLSPSTIGPAAIVIACPRIEYLESIINNQQILSYSNGGDRSGCIFHMVPEEIFSTSEYCSFVEKFSSEKWQHFVLNKSSAYHELIVSSAKLVNGLNEVAPMFYTPLYPYSESDPLPSSLKHMTNIQRGRFRQTAILNPLSPNGSPLIDNSACIEDQDTNFIFEKKSPQQQLSPKKQRTSSTGKSETAIANTIPIVASSRNEFIKSQNQLIESLSDRELEVVFLGTCCSQSSLFRDETCILLNMFDRGSIIFDTGGGSYSQLFRKYGRDQSNQILAGLRFIFISHMHADHHQNLQKLIQARHDAMEELYVPYDKRSLMILSPPGASGFIKDIEQTQTLYAATCTADKSPQPWKYVSFYNFSNYQADGKFSQFMKKELGIVKCQAVSVIHSFGAHGISITSENGWKVSYSGDTAFCKEFNELAENSTLVIHEATFHDCQQEDADSRRHCSISDAIRAFNNTNSHSVILSHFSQRYPNIQKSGLNNGVDGENISFAFDFLSVNIKNLNHLPNALDTLKIDQSENQVDDFEDIS